MLHDLAVRLGSLKTGPTEGAGLWRALPRGWAIILLVIGSWGVVGLLAWWIFVALWH